MKYIPVPLSFCASGKANVNATDINGNNALHLCLMRRPAMMEFAKVGLLSKTLAQGSIMHVKIYFQNSFGYIF